MPSALREGERRVILVRAESCQLFLEQYVQLLREGIWPENLAHFTHFEAQRLRSACERALGTRDRLVDQQRKEAASGPNPNAAQHATKREE